ncbi:hypothetical protein [Caenibius tardaugens]|uniref:hypothetical protein n=1 Tax=Caenibius tardaugens TaxID=169176 RepID=UPI0003F580EE|nr:hypothetical protein [Caenibius tardaugens]AZI36412.1 hypothetical protein EGO55_11010 [Caenibius tardaugens NBRC 16725]
MRPLLLSLALSAGLLPSALFAQEGGAAPLTLADRHIRVRDLAVLSPQQRSGTGALIAATVPEGQRYVELTAERRALLLRWRVPGQILRPLLGGAVRFIVPGEEAMAEDGRAGRECFALRQNLAAGAYVVDAALAPTACEQGKHAKLPLRYDRAAGAAMALRPLRRAICSSRKANWPPCWQRIISILRRLHGKATWSPPPTRRSATSP